MPRLVHASLIVLLAAAGPVVAQPTSQPARPPAATTAPARPPAGTTTPAPPTAPPSQSGPAQPPPPTITITPSTSYPPDAQAELATDPAPVESNAPAPKAAPPQPQPERIDLTNNAYPNGFQDPEFDNMSRADNDRDGGGFPWGVLGLLGLLGLVPWLRGGPKTIYVERERPPRQEPGRGE